ncbi:hypothetical protein C2S52_006961 [Perilla frutescens var. hirtella]|nr:hypothetical protein C2S51_008885 [Perilla frutescens var. frutescens]KAH6787409.1 hypothetical protein C2S52_006961 [Perilla frutescens var. hirtella]
MVGGLNSRTRPYYHRMCKKVSSKNIESLPDELLFDILLRLSVEDLYERARFVCRRWSHIIHSDAFVNTHLHHSTFGLVISEIYGWRNRNLIYVSVTKPGRIEISELICKFRTAWSSCNGLVLELKSSLNILNPATKQTFLLPPFPYECKFGFTGSSGIAYSAASMKYKVVQPHLLRGGSRRMRLGILTVGVDNSWRHVEVEHLPHNVRQLCYHTPLITEGFIHWAAERDNDKVLTMNVETEIITETNPPLPEAYLSTSTHKYYLSTGRYLTLLVRREDLMWEVWEMKSAESGEWRKQRHFQFACEHPEFIWPFGWVKYPEVLACHTGRARTLILYNLRKHEIDSTKELPSLTDDYKAVPHRNTLVWLSP